MKLKSQFLSLSALLAMGMATTAWAQSTPDGYTSATVQLQGDAANGSYNNLPKPSENSGTKLWASLEIPSYVKSFHIYDDGGKDGSFTSTACFSVSCGVYLALSVPEAHVFNIGESLISAKNGGVEATVNVNNGTTYDGTTSTEVLHGYGQREWSQRKSTGENIVIEFHSSVYHSGNNDSGLDLVVDVIIPNMNVIEGGVSNNSYTVSAAANQFNYQVNKGISGVDNTTTLTAPAGYVIYLEGGATVYENGSVAVFDGASTSATKLLDVTGPSTTENAITSGNTITFHATTVNDGMEEVMRLPVHIVKKSDNLSTDGVDIYEDYDESYKVAKISDIATGTVSIASPVNVDAIVYDRKFKANTKETIVLPFSLPEGATTNAKFYYLQKVVQQDNICAWKATLKRVATPEANKPYAIIIENNETELRIDLKGGKATFQTAGTVEQLDQTGKWIFKGTYQNMTWVSGDEEIGLAYALAKENGTNYVAGQFVRIGENSSAAPMRAYMRKFDASVRLNNLSLGRPLAKGEVSSIEDMPEVIDVELVDEDDKPMAIGRLNTVTGAIKINRWIDLKGRSTNHKPTTKGVFFNKKGIAK